MRLPILQRLLPLVLIASFFACTGPRDLPLAPTVASDRVTAEEAPGLPSPRGYVVLVQDPVKDRSFLVGGISSTDLCADLACTDGLIDDLWSFNGKSRAWAEVANVLPPRLGDAGAFDLRSRHIIMFQPFFNTVPETWAYDVGRGTWENRHPALEPPGRIGSMMVFDVEADRVLLYGGSSVSDFSALRDLWAYDYRRNTWTELHPPISPPTREFGAMVYVPTIHRAVVFAGHNQDGALLNDMWAYDSHRNRWTNLDPKNPPAARVVSALAFDRATNSLVLFGGNTAYTVDPGNSLNDTWLYDVGDNRWRQVFPKRSPSPRGWLASTSTKSGVVIFGGGPAGNQFTNDTFLYDSRANTWTKVREEEDEARRP